MFSTDLPYTSIRFYISSTASHLCALWVQAVFAALIAAIQTTTSAQAQLPSSGCKIFLLITS